MRRTSLIGFWALDISGKKDVEYRTISGTVITHIMATGNEFINYYLSSQENNVFFGSAIFYYIRISMRVRAMHHSSSSITCPVLFILYGKGVVSR
jgi:hypothetical protein